ncbi:MAG TPA: NAD(P)/FAD-dependent oxidoreductase [Streptosporangiaceae bacterium]|jgi:thioredoxin reductase
MTVHRAEPAAAGADPDLVIVGGGPAGLAAAIEADRWGVATLLAEDRPALGGQIFRQPSPSLPGRRALTAAPDHARGAALLSRLRQSRVRHVTSATVVDIEPGDPLTVRYVRAGRTAAVRARQVILATGGYDRPVALPGWTLPGVMAAGGAQAMAKSHGVLPAGRVVIAGSGPLLLAFATQLHQWGAQVVAVTELAGRPRARDLAALARAGALAPAYLRQGLRYAGYLAAHRIPVHFRTRATRVLGTGQVTGVVLSRVDHGGRPLPGSAAVLEADCVCLGYGLVPSAELARLAGCELVPDESRAANVPVRTALLETSVPGIFAAGDGVAVRGSDVALLEGQIAGLAASGNLGHASADQLERRVRPLRARLARSLAFQEALSAVYPAAIPGCDLATAGTVLCRCEEVTCGELAEAIRAAAPMADASVVKGMTRAGMGLCQGRMCAANVHELISKATGTPVTQVRAFSPRPPARPVPLAAVMSQEDYGGGDDDIPEDPDCAG